MFHSPTMEQVVLLSQSYSLGHWDTERWNKKLRSQVNSGANSQAIWPQSIAIKSINVSFTRETALPVQSGRRQGRCLPSWVAAVRGHQAVAPTYLEQTAAQCLLLPSIALSQISLPLSLQATDGALSSKYRLKCRQTGALSFIYRLVKPFGIYPLGPL